MLGQPLMMKCGYPNGKELKTVTCVFHLLKTRCTSSIKRGTQFLMCKLPTEPKQNNIIPHPGQI